MERVVEEAKRNGHKKSTSAENLRTEVQHKWKKKRLIRMAEKRYSLSLFVVQLFPSSIVQEETNECSSNLISVLRSRQTCRLPHFVRQLRDVLDE